MIIEVMGEESKCRAVHRFEVHEQCWGLQCGTILQRNVRTPCRAGNPSHLAIKAGPALPQMMMLIVVFHGHASDAPGSVMRTTAAGGGRRGGESGSTLSLGMMPHAEEKERVAGSRPAVRQAGRQAGRAGVLTDQTRRGF